MQQAIIHDVGPKPQCLLVVLVFVGSLHASVALEAHGGSSFVTEPATNFTISSVMRRPFVSKKRVVSVLAFNFHVSMLACMMEIKFRCRCMTSGSPWIWSTAIKCGDGVLL